MVWLLTCRAHLEDDSDSDAPSDYMRFMSDQVGFHTDRLLELGFLQEIEDEFMAPAARSFEDENGEIFYTWDPTCARSRLQTFESRAHQIRQRGIIEGLKQT